ncbi:hypothetical protein DUI87_33228 [Hirundo rustica rustica]|uniref:Ubiquitin-like protease family profile domain-containing protein n=1 Tax=Hirundo rustica rustica TaxID=333673 RepID=A0A3M0IPI1_HIRRU|nr:hypothetical protein DUI87_33228 [Hirundo rustica rustica]
MRMEAREAARARPGPAFKGFGSESKTVREEEREIYRQLLQMVTGKRFSSCKPSPLLPFHLSRCPRSGPSLSQEAPRDDPKALEIPKIPAPVPHPPEPPQNSQNPPLGFPGGFQPRNSAAPQQREEEAAAGAQSEGSDSVILLKVKDSRTPAPRTSVYDSRARERWRQIEEQKALALQLQSQRLQERERSVQDLVDLHLRVPLEKEIPVSVGPEGPERGQGDEEFPEITEVGQKPGEKSMEFQEISEEMEKEIKSLFRGGNQDEVLSEAFRLTITRKDIQTLNNLNWLNDEIINFYMNLLMERSKEKDLPALHAFNTFFFTKLKTSGYQAVKRWTKKWIFSPWIFSWFPSTSGFIGAWLQYLKQESLDKKRKEFDTNGWALLSKKSQEIPQQMNGSDCGMFACRYAECISKDKPINFTQIPGWIFFPCFGMGNLGIPDFLRRNEGGASVDFLGWENPEFGKI